MKKLISKDSSRWSTRFTRATLAMVFALGAGATGVNAQMADNDKDIVDVAVEAGTFNTLAAALQAAGLVDVLKGDGPFTVFAPTDEAFAKLPEGTVEALLADTEQLTAILTYHVVPGNVPASAVVGMSEATTVNGAKVSISVVDGKVMINDATVTATDIAASNGVIHVIDTVILPPMSNR